MLPDHHKNDIKMTLWVNMSGVGFFKSINPYPGNQISTARNCSFQSQKLLSSDVVYFSLFQRTVLFLEKHWFRRQAKLPVCPSGRLVFPVSPSGESDEAKDEFFTKIA